MSINRFAEQTWPDLLSEGKKEYEPEPTHLFPTVIVKKLTKREIDKALRGIHPKPSSKEATTIYKNNIISSLNENNTNFTDDAYTPPVSTTSVYHTDDIPDDPFIPMTSDIDNIESDDSDLPDLSNTIRKKEKKTEKKEISEKKRYNDQDKAEKKHKTSDKRMEKIKIDKNVNVEKKSNEMIKFSDQYKGEKKHKTSDVRNEKNKYEENVKSKSSEKYYDRNKSIEKDKMKYSKSSSDKRESDKDRKEKDKVQSKIFENRDQLKDKEKLTSVNNSAKSTTENSSSNGNSNPVPFLMGFKSKIREMKKQLSVNAPEPAVPPPASIQFNTPMTIKSEPAEINGQDDSMAFQAPALPDDGEFQSQIDSDQETVTFGDTPEKNKDGKINRAENKYSRKKEYEKGIDKIEKRRLSDNSDDKDRNKRKRDGSDSSKESKKWKGDESKKKNERDENKKDRNDSKSKTLSSQIVNKHTPNQKLINNIALNAKSIPPFAAIPTREAEKPASTSMPIVPKSVPVANASEAVNPSALSALLPESETIATRLKDKFMDDVKNKKLERQTKIDLEEIKRKIADLESKIVEVQKEEQINIAEMDNVADPVNDIMRLVEYGEEIAERITKLFEEKGKLVKEEDAKKKSLQEIEAARKRDTDEIESLKAALKALKSSSSKNDGSSSPRPEVVDTNSNQQPRISTKPMSGSSAASPASSNIRTISPSESSPSPSVITTASVREQQQQQQQSSAKSTTAIMSDGNNMSAVSGQSPSLAMNKALNPSVTATPNVTGAEPDIDSSTKSTPAIEETQPNHKCTLCGNPGHFACCGNTIYCGLECQGQDFDRHQDECQNEIPEEDDE